VQLSAEPRFGSDGRTIGAVCVGEDVANTRNMLATTMANHQLQKINDAKDTFLATISHEMRTPLNGLLGMLQLAMVCGEPMTEKTKRYVKQATNSGMLLLNLINDIIDVTRIESGKLDLDVAPFSLREAFEAAVDVVAPKALEKNLELIIAMDATLTSVPHLLGDVRRLSQVLINLLFNALKFTHEGRVSVSARQMARAGRSCHLLIEVEDTGVGIAAEDLDLVFERYAAAGGPKESAERGAGLGLSICKQLVELMGGRIWLDSQELHP